MNKIYKVVWSKVKNCYVVVSELAKNVITGSVKSAKVGAAPMVKGMAMGVLAAFMVTGQAHADWLSDAANALTKATSALGQITDLRKGIEVDIVASEDGTERTATGDIWAKGDLHVIAANGRTGDLSVEGSTTLAGTLTVGTDKLVVGSDGKVTVNGTNFKVDADGAVTAASFNGLTVTTADGTSTLGGNIKATNFVVGEGENEITLTGVAQGVKDNADTIITNAAKVAKITTNAEGTTVIDGAVTAASFNGVAIATGEGGCCRRFPLL